MKNNVPGTRLFIFGTGRRAERHYGMEDIAMLVFFLPIIIFEAMLEAQSNERGAGSVQREGRAEVQIF